MKGCRENTSTRTRSRSCTNATDTRLKSTSPSTGVCLWFSLELFPRRSFLSRILTLLLPVRSKKQAKHFARPQKNKYFSTLPILLPYYFYIASQRFGSAGQAFAFTAARDSAKQPHKPHMPSARYSHFLHWASLAS